METGTQGYAYDGVVGIEQSLYGVGADWFKLLTPVYASVGQVFGQRTQASLSGKAAGFETKAASEYEAYEALLYSWIENEGLEQAKRLAATTKVTLRNLVLAGEQEGLSAAAIARQMKSSIGGLSRTRARTIARTEVHNAAGYANHHAAVSMGVETEKKWLAHPGARTRETHLEAGDGDWLPLNETYTVAGYSMMYPGDSSQGAPPEEIVNCRCGEMQRTAGST
jgi:uncharacterized protein with gpF-like domain